jgi:hypothetical protein
VFIVTDPLVCGFGVDVEAGKEFYEVNSKHNMSIDVLPE